MPGSSVEKRVFWFDDGKRPNVADALEKERDIIVHRLAFDGPPADNWGAMSASHVYCITSARHEVPDEYKCTAALLARCPDLIAVTTTGAGYDTVDIAACTAAGVLVVNQSGANADAVAEHTVAMVLSLTKNIPQTDRSLRTVRGVDREVFKGWNARGRTIGLVGVGEGRPARRTHLRQRTGDARARVRSLRKRGGMRGTRRDQSRSRYAARGIALSFGRSSSGTQRSASTCCRDRAVTRAETLALAAGRGHRSAYLSRL
jgi:hypothetical protein